MKLCICCAIVQLIFMGITADNAYFVSNNVYEKSFAIYRKGSHAVQIDFLNASLSFLVCFDFLKVTSQYYVFIINTQWAEVTRIISGVVANEVFWTVIYSHPREICALVVYLGIPCHWTRVGGGRNMHGQIQSRSVHTKKQPYCFVWSGLLAPWDLRPTVAACMTILLPCDSSRQKCLY